jgi:F-type H+-transporting ATPase subunit alpha
MNLDELKKENIEEIMKTPEKNIGFVLSSLDGYLLVNGLYDVFLGEKVIIDTFHSGIVFDILEDFVVIFNFGQNTISVGTKIERTYAPFSITVSDNMLGHVFDVLGNCIDGEDFSHSQDHQNLPVEREIPNITERKPINTPLETGFLLIDSLIPIGKGQRQLFIGNPNTGKTYTAINTFIRNKDNPNVISIYVTIGQQQSKTAKLREYLAQKNCLKNVIIISSRASDTPINNYLAPFVGCTIAEYFAHEKKKDVIIIYDDLSNQAISYREISLLMKRTPSREAYPGDVFYLHARLLERAGNFINGGSITAIPIAQLQENDLSGYISTNLISITDGQIIFDSKLFNKGFKPAINTELSVSRVGSAAQYENIKSISKSLKLDLAQYSELELFSQFTTDLDEKTTEKLEKGRELFQLLKQPLFTTYTTTEEYIMLYLYKNFYEDLLKIKDKQLFFSWLVEIFTYSHKDIEEIIHHGKLLNQENQELLNTFIQSSFEIYINEG